ncbi:MAG: hypothetical protein KGL39_40710 [Patescibacteria group bacterium]|nr:hypothetical protein [Patescibacteria group bacterium]
MVTMTRREAITRTAAGIGLAAAASSMPTAARAAVVRPSFANDDALIPGNDQSITIPAEVVKACNDLAAPFMRTALMKTPSGWKVTRRFSGWRYMPSTEGPMFDAYEHTVGRGHLLEGAMFMMSTARPRQFHIAIIGIAAEFFDASGPSGRVMDAARLAEKWECMMGMIDRMATDGWIGGAEWDEPFESCVRETERIWWPREHGWLPLPSTERDIVIPIH